MVRHNVARLAAILDDAVDADIAGNVLAQGVDAVKGKNAAIQRVDALLRRAGGVGRKAEELKLQNGHGQRRAVHPVRLAQVHLVYGVNIPESTPVNQGDLPAGGLLRRRTHIDDSAGEAICSFSFLRATQAAKVLAAISCGRRHGRSGRRWDRSRAGRHTPPETPPWGPPPLRPNSQRNAVSIPQ